MLVAMLVFAIMILITGLLFASHEIAAALVSAMLTWASYEWVRFTVEKFIEGMA